MGKPTTLRPCPCGGGAYDQCCAPYHLGLRPAPSAVLLMRSRYSAFVLQLADYLRLSWHPDYCPTLAFNDSPQPKWLGLQVIRHKIIDPTTAEVEFVARYTVGGRAFRQHETSRFVLVGLQWRYTDGISHP